MTLGEHQQHFARDLVSLISHAHSLGYEVRIGEVERPIEMQQIYVRTGRSKTMNSIHIKKCAADLHFFKDGKLVYPDELGEYWESLSPLNSWGGNWNSFKDKPHFQRTV